MSGDGRAEAAPILVPLDGSEASERALRFAALIPGRAVRLLACGPVKLSAARERWARGAVAPDGGSWRVSSPADYLALAGAPLRAADREVEAVTVPGDPGPGIVAAAHETALTVMATRGLGGTRLLLGSTATYVLRNAEGPTVLVRDERPEAGVVVRVVVPLDGSAEAAEALPLAVALRRGLGSTLHLVRVVDPDGWTTRTADGERAAAADLERDVARLGDGAVTTEARVRVARTVAEELRGALMPGDLVVMATRGRGGLRGRLAGSVAAAVAERATVPVVMVRAAPGATEAVLAGSAERGAPVE